VPARVHALLDQVRGLEKELDALKGKLASAQGDELLARAVDVGGLKVLAAMLPGADAKALRETIDRLKDKLKSAAIVLAAVDGGKVQLAAGRHGRQHGQGQGRRTRQLRRPAGRRQGGRQGRPGNGRRNRPGGLAAGAGVGRRLGRRAGLTMSGAGGSTACRIGTSR